MFQLLPNPNYGSRPPSALIFDEELAAHFGPAARGVTRREEAGEYFTGRSRELERIARWLDTPKQRAPGLVVITGSPGCGKSALISRVVVLSDPALRTSIANMDALDESTVPNLNVFNSVVWCRNKSLRQVTAEIATKLGLDAAATPQALIDALESRDVTIAMDALDEAEADEPEAIAVALIRPLSALPQARILVASRRHPVRSAAPEPVDLLELPCLRYTFAPIWPKNCENSRYHPYRILPAKFSETQTSVREGSSGCQASCGFRYSQ